MDPISDVVLSAGSRELSALQRSNLQVARQLDRFSAISAVRDEPEVDQQSQNAQEAAPDLGSALLTLTRNGMATSVISRTLAAELGLYSAVISEGRG